MLSGWGWGAGGSDMIDKLTLKIGFSHDDSRRVRSSLAEPDQGNDSSSRLLGHRRGPGRLVRPQRPLWPWRPCSPGTRERARSRRRGLEATAHEGSFLTPPTLMMVQVLAHLDPSWEVHSAVSSLFPLWSCSSENSSRLLHLLVFPWKPTEGFPSALIIQSG